MEYSIQNEAIKVVVKDIGAELISMILLETGTEYMWDANPEHWGRTSPILFPFIGGSHNGSYTHNGSEYRMEKHGFLRDCEFELLKQEDDEVWFITRDTQVTRAIYPFQFELEIGYCLKARSLEVVWNIRNQGDEVMVYAIGGHPAIKTPLHNNESRIEYGVMFKGKTSLAQTGVSQAGLAEKEPFTITLEDEMIPFSEGVFDADALIFEDSQVQEIALVDASKKPYVTMNFDAPVIAVWSLESSDAGFVCLEPWYGLCDVDGVHVPLAERKWMNQLAPHTSETKGYTLTI